MPPILVGVIVLFLAAVVIYVLRRRSPMDNLDGDPELQDEVYDFPEDAEGIAAKARRRIRFVVPVQTIANKKWNVRIDLDPLPAPGELQVPANKGIEALQVLVANPVAHTKDTNESMFDFEQPIGLTVYYNKEDTVETTLDDDGKPRLSIVSGYEGVEGWRFERLPTTVTPDPATGGGTLEAPLKTLHPNDPVWIGRP